MLEVLFIESIGSRESLIMPMSKVGDDEEEMCGLALRGE
jgi:hypothetical protein